MIITNLVQETIKTIYPKYYLKDIIDFFIAHHRQENIGKDVESGNSFILLDNDGQLIGTGSHIDNHITRVYVSPDHQGKGYGRLIMKKLEDEISKTHDEVLLDASLPANIFYEKLGYQTLQHKHEIVGNQGIVMVYDIMRKKLK